jgi:putative ABC transport system ATP-binding protein
VPDIALAVNNASVSYGTGGACALALDQASGCFQPGEVTLVMGASGSGKTTLLSVLGCLRKPDRGTVTLLGRELGNLREPELVAVRRRHIGFVFQFFRLFDSLSAWENVNLGLELSGAHKSASASEDVLDAVGLRGKLHLLPHEMSGGERQRVAIARALVKGPQILLADEPTASLDSRCGTQVGDLIRSMVKTLGITAVIATHDARLQPIADRVMEIRDGRLHEPAGRVV